MEELFKVREKVMKKLVIATAVSAVLLTGCAGTYDKAQTGAVLGALTGTALAYGLGKDSGNKDLWLIAGGARAVVAYRSLAPCCATDAFGNGESAWRWIRL